MFGDVKELNTALYLMQKFSLSHKLDITGGLRADYFSNSYNDRLTSQLLSSSSTLLSPKLNFNYKVNNNVQLYLYNGRGFHSNDTRVAVQQNGKKVLPPGWGTDIGGIFKVSKKLVLQSAFWHLLLDQEFIYVGDEGIVEPGGQTRRVGLDVSARYEVIKNLFADVDLPLSPRFSSVGGFTYKQLSGWNGSIRYRLMGARPANEDNSVVAKGYFVTDAAINYTKQKWEAGVAIQNLFNTRWKETQFDTESRLKDEAEPVSEIHFTPGTPFSAKVSFSLFF
jgi:outer membrane receptor protein involved in Fe transport